MIQPRQRPTVIYSAWLGQSVRRVARLLAENDVGAVPVLEPVTERMLGVFSERDLLKRVVAVGLDPDKTLVDDVMTREVVTATPEDSMHECISKMRALRCRHLPIVAEGRPIAMLSLRDLMEIELSRKARELEDLKLGVFFQMGGGAGLFIIWRCLSCGEHHRGDQPPARCAGCGAARTEFELVQED